MEIAIDYQNDMLRHTVIISRLFCLCSFLKPQSACPMSGRRFAFGAETPDIDRFIERFKPEPLFG